MNVKLVESLAQIIDSLTPEEKAFLEGKSLPGKNNCNKKYRYWIDKDAG